MPMFSHEVPQKLVINETNSYRWRLTRVVRWANGYGANYRSVFEYSPAFKALSVAEIVEFVKAINVELDAMNRDLSGSELPVLVMADAVEAKGEPKLAAALRQRADQWFCAPKRVKARADADLAKWLESLKGSQQ